MQVPFFFDKNQMKFSVFTKKSIWIYAKFWLAF